MKRVFCQRVGKGRISFELNGHLLLHGFKEFLRLASSAIVVSNGCDQAVEVVGVTICFVGRDDGGDGNFQLFKLATRSRVVQIKAEVGTINRVQATVSKLVNFFAFAKASAFLKVVRGDDCVVQVCVKKFKLLVHVALVVVLVTTNNMKGRKSSQKILRIGSMSFNYLTPSMIVMRLQP